MMRIDTVNSTDMVGVFYRQGVIIQQGKINSQLGSIYASLICHGNRSKYYSSFHYKGVKLYDIIHAIDRGLLGVWIIEK